MSAVVIVENSLRERIAKDLRKMQRDYPRSIAGEIREEFFENVVDEVAATIDLGYPDFEVALVCSTSRVKEKFASHFNPRRTRSNAMTLFAKKIK